MIVEGFLILEDARLLSRLDKVVVLQVSKEECYRRRVARKYDHLSDYLVGMRPDEAPQNWLELYFEDAIWPAAVKYSGLISLREASSPRALKETSLEKVMAISGELNADDLHKEVLALLPPKAV